MNDLLIYLKRLGTSGRLKIKGGNVSFRYHIAFKSGTLAYIMERVMNQPISDKSVLVSAKITCLEIASKYVHNDFDLKKLTQELFILLKLNE